MKYFIIAGERSGDLHGGNLIRSLRKDDPKAEIKAFGGDAMSAAGAEVLVHYREMAFMGFWEVFKNLATIRRLLRRCKEEISQFKPDVVILIDYAGFNMKIAQFAQGTYKVFYYISPKVWAWNQKRAWKIKRFVDRMFVIMPFEKEFYQQFDWEVDYVGNPVLDAVNDHEPNRSHVPFEQPYVAVLPGSRKQEVANVASVLEQVADQNAHLLFAVAAVDNLPEELYSGMAARANIKLVYGHTYDLLAFAQAAIVTSGTATLETAMWNVPQVVVYKTSGISYSIAKRLIKVQYISLVNLIAGKEVVVELIQNEFNVERLNKELKKLLSDTSYRRKIDTAYKEMRNLLSVGRASDNAARLMSEYLTKKRGA